MHVQHVYFVYIILCVHACVRVYVCVCMYVCTVLPRIYAHACIKLNLKRMLQAPQTDAHVLLFAYVRLLLNCLQCT